MLTELDLSLRLRCATDAVLTLEDNVCVCVWQFCMYVTESRPISGRFSTVKNCDLAGFAGRAGTCPSVAENAWFVNDLELAETPWIAYTMFLWACTHEFAHLDARICICKWEIVCKCLDCLLCFCAVCMQHVGCWSLCLCQQKPKFIFNLQSIYIQNSLQSSYGYVLIQN